MNEWNGEERRSSNKDHDLLTKIDANIENFMRRFDDHLEEDKEKFAELTKGQAKIQWYIAVGCGIIITLKFLLK
jgi:hypothetical protein